MTIVGMWIGHWQLSLIPLNIYFNNWPRNFSIALFVELLIAQPIGQQVMFYRHKKIIRK